MRSLITILLLFSLIQTSCGQSFLKAYKACRLKAASTISVAKTKKKARHFIRSQMTELDTIFLSYKAKNGFDFNSADTIFFIYDAPAESPYTSDIIIWSGKDTISYRQGFETTAPFKHRRIVTYAPFISTSDKQKGFKVVTERDSLVTLVSNRDFTTINHLGDNQTIYDGGYVSIYVAYKENGKYKFETCFPKTFHIPTIYKKE